MQSRLQPREEDREMKRYLGAFASVGLLLGMLAGETALAQKQGGVLKMSIYPCHVAARDMRTHPIGTGPFKFVEFKPNEVIRVTRNPDYWKQGRPYLDGIEYRIIPNLATRILGFVSDKFDT